MDALTTGPLIAIGFTVGVTLMNMAFVFVMPAVVKIPGSESATYWGAGFVLLGVSMALYIVQREPGFSLLRVVAFAGWVGAGMLLWIGDRYFYLQKPGKAIWPIAGLVAGIYAVLEWRGMPSQLRPAWTGFWSILYWNCVLVKIFASTKIRFTLATCLMISGISLLIASSAFRMLAAFQLLPLSENFSQDANYNAARFLGTFIGAVLFGTSQLLRYFERVVQQSNHAATHDELTGLLNRRAIVSNGEREIAIARRNGQPLAVAFVDIDFFKKINDQFGHDKGDVALKEVAQVLLESCRSVDLLGRYGGEEFCLIFPGDDHAGAVIVGERLLAAVREHQIAGLPPVTISIGLAVLDPNDPTQTWHGLVNLADVELYKAKHSGRDRSSIASKSALVDKANGQIPAPVLAAAR